MTLNALDGKCFNPYKAFKVIKEKYFYSINIYDFKVKASPSN
jgi:hypothetical protein